MFPKDVTRTPWGEAESARMLRIGTAIRTRYTGHALLSGDLGKVREPHIDDA